MGAFLLALVLFFKKIEYIRAADFIVFFGEEPLLSVIRACDICNVLACFVYIQVVGKLFYYMHFIDTTGVDIKYGYFYFEILPKEIYIYF